jgi:hypothetical protein
LEIRPAHKHVFLSRHTGLFGHLTSWDLGKGYDENPRQ